MLPAMHDIMDEITDLGERGEEHIAGDEGAQKGAAPVVVAFAAAHLLV